MIRSSSSSPSDAHRELQAAADAKELEELREACSAPLSEGVQFASSRLEAAQAEVKEQFKVVFQDFKDALEVGVASPLHVVSLQLLDDSSDEARIQRSASTFNVHEPS